MIYGGAGQGQNHLGTKPILCQITQSGGGPRALQDASRLRERLVMRASVLERVQPSGAFPRLTNPSPLQTHPIQKYDPS